MAKRKIFYSFHYDNDVFRVQQIRNIGVLEGDEPVSVNTWETIKRGGKGAIEKWIEDNLKNKTCLVVLVGSQTSTREWVNYEITRAWNLGKGVFGIYIDDLIDPRFSKTPPYYGRSNRGVNPFDHIKFDNGSKLSSIVPCYSPPSADTYKYIAANMENWVELAIAQRN
jgi:hypothetical protein